MKKRVIVVSILTSLLFGVIFLLAVSWGSHTMTFQQVLRTLVGGGDHLQNITVWDIRMPRIVMAIVVAVALSTAGCILQSVTKNELAEPGMIGINAGAALAVVFLISYGQTSYYDSMGSAALLMMPMVAIMGALISGGLIYRLSDKQGISPTRLILTGIGVNVGINAVISLYQLNMSKGDYNQVLTWISGSLWGSSWKFFVLIAPLVVLFLGLVIWKTKILDVLSLGDELAIGLGVNVEKERKILFFYATALAALATAVAGNIAFLGLLGPHIAKRLVGPIHRRQIPIAALISSSLIIFADTLSRNIFSPIEIPVGVTLSIIGVPYFIYLMMKE
ncbi:MAG: FecCD family ABC transporter permease [Cellulosilyticaceae bacterium]